MSDYVPPRTVANALSVGDQVGVSSRYDQWAPLIGTVTHISKARTRIAVSIPGVSTPAVFKEGTEYGERYHPRVLMPAERVPVIIAAGKARRELEHKQRILANINWEHLNAELVDKVIAIVAPKAL